MTRFSSRVKSIEVLHITDDQAFTDAGAIFEMNVKNTEQ